MGEIYYNLGQKKPEKRFTCIDVSAIDKEHGIISDNFQILEPEDAPSRARKIVKKRNGYLFYCSTIFAQYCNR